MRLHCNDCREVFYTREVYEVHLSAHEMWRIRQALFHQQRTSLPGSAQVQARPVVSQLAPTAGRFVNSLPLPGAGPVIQSRPMNDGGQPQVALSMGPPAVPPGRFMNRVPLPVTAAGPVIRSRHGSNEGGRRYNPYGIRMSQEDDAAFRQRHTKDLFLEWPCLLGEPSNNRGASENQMTREENVDLSLFRSPKASDQEKSDELVLELKLGL